MIFRKILLLFFCLSLFLTLKLFAQSNNKIELNLDKSIAIALENNRDYKIAKLRREKAKSILKQAWGTALVPRINANANYTYALKRPVITLETPFFSGSFPVGTQNQVSLSANAEMTLLSATAFLAIRAAEIFNEISDIEMESSRLKLITQTKKAYYSTLLAKENLKLARSNYQLAEKAFKNAEALFGAGIIEEAEYMRAKSQALNAYPGILEAENGLKLAEDLLKLTLGLPFDTELILIDSLIYQDESLPSFDEILVEFENSNGKIKQMRLNVSLKEKNYQANYFEHYPTLSGFANIQSLAQENNERDYAKYRFKTSSSVGLTLRIPLLNSLQTDARAEQAKIDMLEAKEEAEKNELQLKIQLETAYRNLEKTKKLIFAYQSAMEAARKGYELADNKFSAGLGSQLQLMDAQNNYILSQVRYYSAIYEYNLQKAELEELVFKKIFK